MNARLLATTALAVTLAMPAAAIAAQQNQAAQSGSQAQQAQRTGAGGDEQHVDLRQVMEQLRSARQSLAGATQGGDRQIDQARRDARQAIQHIEMALQAQETEIAPDRRDSLRQAKQSVDKARSELQRENAQPQRLADSLGDVDSAVADLLEQRDRQAAAGSSSVSRSAQNEAQTGTRNGAGNQGAADVQVRQPAADVTVRQPAPEVTVQQREPKVTVTQPKPKVTVEQPKPEVTVETQKPDVNVTTREPDVRVKQGEAEVEVEQDRQAEVEVRDRGTGTNAGRQAERSSGQSERTAAAGVARQDAGPMWTRDQLVGQTLYGANNEEVGEIDRVVMGQDGGIASVLIDVGGFLGIGGKQVAIPVDGIRMQGDQLVSASLTRRQAEDMPEYRAVR